MQFVDMDVVVTTIQHKDTGVTENMTTESSKDMAETKPTPSSFGARDMDGRLHKLQQGQSCRNCTVPLGRCIGQSCSQSSGL